MHCLDTWKASKCAFPSASAVTWGESDLRTKARKAKGYCTATLRRMKIWIMKTTSCTICISPPHHTDDPAEDKTPVILILILILIVTVIIIGIVVNLPSTVTKPTDLDRYKRGVVDSVRSLQLQSCRRNHFCRAEQKPFLSRRVSKDPTNLFPACRGVHVCGGVMLRCVQLL